MKNSLLKSPLLWIFLGALVIRLVGIDWGLPNNIRAFSLHPDEQVNLIYARQIEPLKFKFTPGFYNYGTLYLTLLRIVSDVVGTYAGGFDQAGNLTPFGMGQVHLAGRILNSLFGAGLASVTYLMAARFLKPTAAVFAGILAAVAPALVVHSRFQTVDMLAALLATASVYFSLKLIDEKVDFVKTVVIAGTLAGLSAGTKYVGIVALFSLVPVLVKRGNPESFKGFGIALVACLLAFLVATPGALLDREVFIHDFMFEVNHSKTGHGIVFAGTSPAALYHIGNLSLGFSIICTLLGVLGLVLSVAKRQLVGTVLLTFGLLYFAAVSGGQIKFMRYILPLIPVLAVGTGMMLNRLEELKGTRWAIIAGMLLVGGFDRGALNGTAVFTAAMKAPDARDSAGQWLKQQGAESVGIATDPWFWSATLQPEMPVSRMMGRRRLVELWKQWENPKVVRIVTEQVDETPEWDPRILSIGKPDYFVFTSLEYAAVDRLAQQKSNPEYQQLVDRYNSFIQELGANYTAVWQNEADHIAVVEDMEYVRPRVVIWKRKSL